VFRRIDLLEESFRSNITCPYAFSKMAQWTVNISLTEGEEILSELVEKSDDIVIL
jgi:hypothetical protein